MLDFALSLPPYRIKLKTNGYRRSLLFHPANYTP